MGAFDELESQYNSIENEYARIELEAGRRGWLRKEDSYRRKRQLNDQAYFLFMFTRLEFHINQETERLINKRKASSASWKQKAPWENLPDEAKDIPFKKRLALLVQKGHGDFNLVSEYYKERNSIAHGGGFQSAISMPVVIADFVHLYKRIRA